MNSRNIKSNLSKKFNEWADSIQDEKVRELVRVHSIITGGAITSLLLGEKPSDYDIYFDNFETTVKVANYYAQKIKSAQKVHVGIGDRKFIYGDDSGQDWETLSLGKHRVWLVIQSVGVAGEQEVEGYRYFETIADPENVNVEQYVEELTGRLEKEGKDPYQPIFSSSNAITLSNRIQVIIRFYGPPEEIHKNFDFEHCKNWWRSKDGHLELTLKALECTLNKQLVYSGSKYPLASMFRLRKFLSKDWYINVADMLKIGYQISELDLNDIETLEDQLTGVDAAYFTSLIKYLRDEKEKDPSFNMGFNYLSKILEKVF